MSERIMALRSVRPLPPDAIAKPVFAKLLPKLVLPSYCSRKRTAGSTIPQYPLDWDAIPVLRGIRDGLRRSLIRSLRFHLPENKFVPNGHPTKRSVGGSMGS